jgi:hypothetical protein
MSHLILTQKGKSVAISEIQEAMSYLKVAEAKCNEDTHWMVVTNIRRAMDYLERVRIAAVIDWSDTALPTSHVNLEGTEPEELPF